jgi:cytochrome c peroxidase
MHTGQFATLADVVEHYNGGGYSLPGHDELKPLGLSPEEASQLAAFLRTLTAEAR